MFKKIALTASVIAMMTSPALAAGSSDSATGNATAKVLLPISIAETLALDFGEFTAGTGGVVNSDGITVPTLDVTELVAGNDATFDVTGETGQAYTVTFDNNSVTLSGPGLDMTATLSASGNDNLSAGADVITVNGILAVGSGQTPGDYSGTYDISVAYD